MMERYHTMLKIYCPYRFKLSMFYGFAQPLVPALGYGNVMHEIAKNIHKAAIVGKVIDKEDVKRMIKEVQTDIKDAAANIRRNYLPRKCDKENCSKCHFNYLCLSKAEKKAFEIG